MLIIPRTLNRITHQFRGTKPSIIHVQQWSDPGLTNKPTAIFTRDFNVYMRTSSAKEVLQKCFV
ncbi:hypothetical protein L798_15387 [Zootermopsis nevadensis]|uniref:Uncharacterized protein n=1 Tax=Zootermopsis nevadensis TaxID=136037 RepID=A0A067QX90_ZOONE|nr:hypothetical protein L798_15387 [Zootermopsis nevadensis]